MDTGSQPQTAAQWVKQHSKHRKAMRQVLTELAMFIDAGNPCPSHKDIADETGLSKSTVRHSLGELEKDGTISIVKNGGAKVKGGKKDCYTIVGFTPVKPQTEPEPAPESVVMVTAPVETVVMESAVMTTTVTTTVVNPEPVEYVRVDTPACGDAAGEKDLSLRAKEKDKKPFSPGKTGESKGARKKSIRPAREPNPLFDAIAWHIFDFLPTETEAIGAAGSRIGEMLRDFPANKTTLTADRIAQFGRWWNANKKGFDGKPINKPLTAGKLARHWSDFERANPIKTAVSQQAAQQREADNREYLEQEHRRIQREMLGVPS
jgi:DNA-binding transcriptional regulator YhcF (GntR family)